ncbi:dethiobiotin synthase [Fictibacillus sp. FJAT-27399]|uniref:dethiobiotin synthase n=1 Tax=Fictibacillus sp. FJAT-27399 TaxID=1729689 RepID=UPI000782561B|nr:dethiobiotin synthase [Fictibacillus sp. FJAT-27399]
MGQAYFITGTGTEIGKTVATSLLYLSLTSLGKSVTIFKPFQTGLDRENHTYPDISWYEEQLGVKDCGMYMLEPETSPHLAIKLTGRKVDEQRVIDRIHALKEEYEIVLVEGAGGIAVPLIEQDTHFYMTADLIKDCGLPVIFVSNSGLGSIHHVLTTQFYTALQNIDIKTILFNFFQHDNIIHRDNVETITKLTGLEPLVRIPAFKNVKEDLPAYIASLLKDQHYLQLLNEVFFNEYSIH